MILINNILTKYVFAKISYPISEIKDFLGPNNLPYEIPIHPNLVHLTIDLFAIGIAFDFAGAFYPFEKRNRFRTGLLCCATRHSCAHQNGARRTDRCKYLVERAEQSRSKDLACTISKLKMPRHGHLAACTPYITWIL